MKTYCDRVLECQTKVDHLNEFFKGKNNFIRSMSYLKTYSHGQMETIERIYNKYLERGNNENQNLQKM